FPAAFSPDSVPSLPTGRPAVPGPPVEPIETAGTQKLRQQVVAVSVAFGFGISGLATQPGQLSSRKPRRAMRLASGRHYHRLATGALHVGAIPVATGKSGADGRSWLSRRTFRLAARRGALDTGAHR